MINSEELTLIIQEIVRKEITLPFVMGSIKGGKVQFDGEDSASFKTYKKLNNISLADGDRVLLANVSGTFVILGKLV
jgi:hypothetical protein